MVCKDSVVKFKRACTQGCSRVWDVEASFEKGERLGAARPHHMVLANGVAERGASPSIGQLRVGAFLEQVLDHPCCALRSRKVQRRALVLHKERNGTLLTASLAGGVESWQTSVRRSNSTCAHDSCGLIPFLTLTTLHLTYTT
eukprot:6186173-Pleurochrysis_carterae.AAC.2